MNDPTGGPAFPIALALKNRDGETRKMEVNSGMSLRAWIAGRALTGIIAGPVDDVTHAQAAEEACAYADALIAELSKPVAN